ncbi:MDR family MFS transporter [Symbiobacterium terraclitae]|uniref:MDR family MFS transporter n=1 Tax=Symbiobacterium terraclitae TaxID=557451 RepID=UPI0035B5487B
MNLRARLRAYVDAYPRMLWFLAIGSFLNSTGASFIWPLTTIYIHEHLGRSMTVAGTVLLLHSAGAMLGQLAGGWGYDRIGPRPVMLGGLFAATAVTAVLGQTSSWPVYVACMVLYGIALALPLSPVGAMLARVWPGQGRRAFNFNYVASNLGVAAGTALGGVLADRSFALAFGGASVLFLLYGLFAAAFIREERVRAGDVREGDGRGREAAPEGPVPWPPIIALFVAYLCITLVYGQWQTGNSIRTQELGFGLSAFSVLWTLNGVLIFAGQPVLSLIVRRMRRPTAQMVAGVALLALAFGVLLTSDRYGIFVLSMVLLTFGEMLVWPVIPATVARLSPPSKRGRLQGLILSGQTVGRMLGPLLGGMLYDAAGYTAQISVMTAGLAVPLLAILYYARTRWADEAAQEQIEA